MRDYAGFCRQVAVSYFHRRCNYPVGSDERARLMREARCFLLFPLSADWFSFIWEARDDHANHV